MNGSALEMTVSMLDFLNFQLSEIPNMVFFSKINDFLTLEITTYAGQLLSRVAKFVGAFAASVMTIWIIFHGYRIATGQSREPMMGLVVSSLRAVLIVGVAVGAMASAGSTYKTLTDGLNQVVHESVTGEPDGGTYEDIDETLGYLQLAIEIIDSVDVGDNVITNDRKQQALWMTGVGLGGPAVMGAVAMLLNKIALALFVGLGPFFILCLLFDQTKQLFSRWLFLGIGTMFSMAFLTVMVTLALDLVIAVAITFWTTGWLSGNEQQSLMNMAMQQGGLGVVLSMLILSAPPMAAMFFQGTMGQFYNTNALAGSGNNNPPGHPGQPLAPASPSPSVAGNAELERGKGSAAMARPTADTSHSDTIRSGPR